MDLGPLAREAALEVAPDADRAGRPLDPSIEPGAVGDCDRAALENEDARAPQQETRKTIVIVDDEFGLADVLAASLSDLGFRVHTAANGTQALQVLAEHDADLVLLDYMMPLLDGPGVLRAMHGEARLANIPVIVMSSLHESAVAPGCPGYLAFLRKPFGFEALLACIEQALGAPSAPESAERSATQHGRGA
jgi:DNA-binding NtrC family response regulator